MVITRINAHSLLLPVLIVTDCINCNAYQLMAINVQLLAQEWHMRPMSAVLLMAMNAHA